MSVCRDKELLLACFTPNNGNDPVTIKHVTVFDEAGQNIATYYTDDAGVTVDPAIYLGGGVASLWSCVSDSEFFVMCDTVPTPQGNVTTRFLRRIDIVRGNVTVVDTQFDGTTVYTAQGQVAFCEEASPFDTEGSCFTTTANTTPTPVWVRHDDSFVGMTAAHVNPAGFAVFDRTTGQPVNISQPGFLLGDCQTCCPTQLGSGCWENLTGSGEWISFRETDGTITRTDTVTGDPVAIADVVACVSLKQEVTQLSTPNGAVFTIPSASDLTSWSIRHVSGTVTVRVNTGPEITLQVGESLRSDAQDDGILNDAVSVNAQSGEARVLWTQLVI